MSEFFVGPRVVCIRARKCHGMDSIFLCTNWMMVPDMKQSLSEVLRTGTESFADTTPHLFPNSLYWILN
jgi:hypothetical protein